VLTVTTAAELRAELARAREDGRVLGGGRVAYVPTMGALHAGHLSLVAEARRRADLVAMSIFVNPLQFGPGEDFARYPRDLAADSAAAAAAGVDLMFAPGVAELYPREPRVRVVPGAMADRWEGAVRPGHFAGVLTVVAKLFHLVAPDVAVFGQKDAQQAALVRAMVRDLDFPLEVVVAPTVRERDGLALSSRNVYLGADDRARARCIPESLAAVERAFGAGERRAAALLDAARGVLAREPDLVPDYVAIVDPDTLDPVEQAERGTLALAAVRAGRTRLLDNVVLGEPAFGTGLA
jgi:pantoate--beta-alanine ligase